MFADRDRGTLLQEPVGGSPDVVPPSPYGAAKWAAAAYARMFHALYGTPVVIVRPSMVYGPGQGDLDKIVPYTACRSSAIARQTVVGWLARRLALRR